MVINEQRSLQDIMARKKILFYGIGNQFKDCFELFRNKENIILFDSNKAGNDCGTYVIHAPEELITYYQEGDAVIISCIKNQYEIAWNLVKKYNIKEDDIFSFTSRVYEERVYLPELIKTNVEKIRFVYNLIEDQESKEYWKNSLLMRMTRQPLQIKNNKNSVVLGEYKDVLELEKQDIIIDCGAYIGDTAKIYNERLQGNCSIYAVEPMKENYEELVKNIKINAWKNVWAYHCAVGSKESRAILRYKKEDLRMGITIGSAVGECVEEIDVHTLDTLFMGIPKINSIKMDIEGQEVEALIGAEKIIKRDSPKLMISGYHKVSDFWEIPSLIKSFNPQYKIYVGHAPGISTEVEYYCTI